jgi:hypothetical protein
MEDAVADTLRQEDGPIDWWRSVTIFPSLYLLDYVGVIPDALRSYLERWECGSTRPVQGSSP